MPSVCPKMYLNQENINGIEFDSVVQISLFHKPLKIKNMTKKNNLVLDQRESSVICGTATLCGTQTAVSKDRATLLLTAG